MRLLELRIQNYRTIVELSLKFPHYYTAICGRNDAGKSNVIRVLRRAFQRPDRIIFMPESDLSLKEDFTKWKERDIKLEDRFIAFTFVLSISREDDEGLHNFLQDYLNLDDLTKSADQFDISVSIRKTADDKSEQFGLSIAGIPYEANKAAEVYKRIRSSAAMLFHDSTEFFHPFRFRESADLFRDMSSSDTKKLKTAQDNVGKILTGIAKRSQQDLTEMLGRLKEKYKIGLSIAALDISDIPYSIKLGTEDGDVELENWGSGTQNRTRILMTLFKAKQVRSAEASSDKVTPIIIIEEPESYLHPSAQAEFGRTLRDLAEEFKIQVLVTTHSPYLLSLSQSEANILLTRKPEKKRMRETEAISPKGDGWVEPFSFALGIGDSELTPWKDVLFSGKESVLLVEGEIDREYLEILKGDEHGENRLEFQGAIFAYGGKDTLKQRQLIRFISSQFKSFTVTYDLDCEYEVEPVLKELGLIRNRNYISIGKDVIGKKSIEGLLPDNVLKAVYANNVDLVQKATAATGSDAKSAKSSLKRAYLEEFRKTAKPLTDDYKALYSLARQLNKVTAN